MQYRDAPFPESAVGRMITPLELKESRGVKIAAGAPGYSIVTSFADRQASEHSESGNDIIQG